MKRSRPAKNVNQQVDEEIVKRQGLIEHIEEQIKKLGELKKASTSEEEIEDLNLQIQMYENSLERLDQLGLKMIEVKRKGVKPLLAEIKEMPIVMEKVTTKSLTSFSAFTQFLAGKIEVFMDRFGNMMFELANSTAQLFNNLAERANQRDEERIDSIQEMYDKQIDAAGENQTAVVALEERRDREIQQIEDRMARRRERAARFAKAVRIAEAVMETAYWVTRFGVITPPAILAGAIGAVKVAAIAAEPIPSYFKGTQNHPGGLAEVAERGREIIKKPGEQAYVQKKRAVVDLPKGTKVFTNPVSERMLNNEEREAFINRQSASDMAKAARLERAEAIKALAPIMERETDVMIDGFKEAIGDLPVTIFDIKRDKLNKSVRIGNTTWKNVEDENSYKPGR